MTLSMIGTTPKTSQLADNTIAQLGKDSDQFLKLLIAQIQHQDPLEPMDSTEFMGQIAQLTSAEQQAQTNKNLENLGSQLAMTSAMFEVNLVGRNVTVPSETFGIDENGGGFSYKLENEASGVAAQIIDSNGQVIHQISNLSGEPGKTFDVRWDGRYGNGQVAAPGYYRVQLSIQSGSGLYDTYANIGVRSVDFADGKSYLNLDNGTRVETGEITRAS